MLLALTAGASVAGILGMLLAVPLTAAAFGVVDELQGRYGASSSRASGPAAGPAPSSGAGNA
ncbi:AI-2E family transporter OS=Streptomyces tendae OX=1932 GN=GUR47_20630 PE=3 SV=1 [Streptomyces tendae]